MRNFKQYRRAALSFLTVDAGIFSLGELSTHERTLMADAFERGYTARDCAAFISAGKGIVCEPKPVNRSLQFART